jgi:hypothetical protein
MSRGQVTRTVLVNLLWWLVLYAWLVHGLNGAYNLLMAGAVLSVLLLCFLPFAKGDAALVRPPLLRQFMFGSGLLFILVLVWFGHGWLATSFFLNALATSFWQFKCRKAAGLEA